MSIVRDLAKSVLDLGQAAYGEIGRRAGFIDFPVPPNSNMRKTSSKALSHYKLSGIKTGLPVTTAATLSGFKFAVGSNILDFGAGVARQLNYFVRRYPGVQFYACDAEPSAIEWLKKTYPAVDSYTNQYLPPLKYDRDTFDLIYSVSIFSHLTKTDCEAWLKEFVRVTKKGGICCITTMGYPALRSGTTEFDESDLERLKSEGTLHYDYDFLVAERQRKSLVGDKGKTRFLGLDYGVTFFTPDYIARNWNSAEWEVVGIAEGVIDDLQDLVVLKKR